MKNMNFKPTKKKLFVSIGIGAVMTIVLPLLWWVIFCRHMSCIALLVHCDIYNSYSCCAHCVTSGVAILQIIIPFLVTAIIVYILKSRIRKKSTS